MDILFASSLGTPVEIARSIGQTNAACSGAGKQISGSWCKGSLLGAGSFGKVYKAQDAKTGRLFAVKEASLGDGDGVDCKHLDQLNTELEISRSARHPNVVSHLGHEFSDGKMYIFLEYVAGGSMASHLREFGPLAGNVLQQATYGIVDGLRYLHTMSPPVVHRDVKGANILVGSDFCVKLTDFGCSKQHDVTKSFRTVGSIPWMAPEVIMHQKGHGRRADMWSLGCTVLEMATAEPPWGRDAFDNMIAAVRRIGMTQDLPDIPADVPPLCDDFIRSCIKRDAQQRLNTKQAIKHEFLASFAQSAC